MEKFLVKRKTCLVLNFLREGFPCLLVLREMYLLFIFFLKNFGMDISTFSTPKMLLMEIN